MLALTGRKAPLERLLGMLVLRVLFELGLRRRAHERLHADLALDGHRHAVRLELAALVLALLLLQLLGPRHGCLLGVATAHAGPLDVLMVSRCARVRASSCSGLVASECAGVGASARAAQSYPSLPRV